MSSDLFFETQDLVVEIETSDATLGSHTALRLYYIYTDADGVEAAEDYKEADDMETSVLFAALDPLEIGNYRVWGESVNAAGKKCITPAFEIPAWARGTVRR
jgi:hypothetical protein